MPGMPFNVTASDARGSILGVLGSWAGMIVEERQVSPPARTVGALVRFLRRQVDWLAAHVAAADASDEVAQLVRWARRVAYPNPTRRVSIGPCVEPGCPGELVAFVHPRQPQQPAEISCGVDPAHSWLTDQWMQLSRRTGPAPVGSAPPTRWLGAADISRLWGISSGSVYRLASEQQWRRRSRAGRTYYHGADVLHTFSNRTTRPAGN